MIVAMHAYTVYALFRCFKHILHKPCQVIGGTKMFLFLLCQIEECIFIIISFYFRVSPVHDSRTCTADGNVVQPR